MAQININIHMGETLKRQFDHLCDKPNPETLAAIDDVNHEKNLSRPFHSVSELIEDLNA